MDSFRAYFKKEIKEAARTNRYLILATGFVFWSILNPLMIKLMPLLIKDQMPGILLEELMNMSKAEAIKNYHSDLYSMGLLFTVFSLMGILADEISLGKLVLPYTKGVNPSGMVLAKTLHYILVISFLIFLAVFLNYHYVSMFFAGDDLSFKELMPVILLYIIFYTFIITLMVLMSSLFKKGIISAIAVLLISYFHPPFVNLKAFTIYLPINLLKLGQLGNKSYDSLLPTMIFTLILSIIFVLLAVYRMKRVELA